MSSNDDLPNALNDQLTWVASPAKLNLFLHITGRYPNGYHELQTLFQILDYGDKIGIRITKDPNIAIMTPINGVREQDNLVYRAAKILQQHCRIDKGCDIHIDKVLPMGGGIGGGSSNAATTLALLNKLWHCHLTLDELAKIGLALGADVPVFVHGYSAFAHGVGERLSPVDLPSKWYLVATPKNIHIATSGVFAHPELPRNTAKIDTSDYQFEKTHNDCETLVAKLHPEVAYLLQWLLNYAPSRLTGTGASVFGVFESQQDAQSTLLQLPLEYTGFVSRGVNLSPLHQQIQNLSK